MELVQQVKDLVQVKAWVDKVEKVWDEWEEINLEPV
jgi:hypothetical protein